MKAKNNVRTFSIYKNLFIHNMIHLLLINLGYYRLHRVLQLLGNCLTIDVLYDSAHCLLLIKMVNNCFIQDSMKLYFNYFNSYEENENKTLTLVWTASFEQIITVARTKRYTKQNWCCSYTSMIEIATDNVSYIFNWNKMCRIVSANSKGLV